MTRLDGQDIVLKNIKDNLKGHPAYVISGKEPFLAISAFHYIETIPDTTPMEMAQGLLSRVDEDLAIAFKADGIFCLFVNYDEPIMVIASTLEGLRDTANSTPNEELKSLTNQTLNLLEENLAVAA